MIKPIETVYKGYRFRSRLEARWAVYFDAMQIQWEYEKEGYDLGELGWYLPDFWLSEFRVWAEVKPEELSPLELAKCQRLQELTKHEVLLLVGTPESKVYCSADGGQYGLFDFRGHGLWSVYIEACSMGYLEGDEVFFTLTGDEYLAYCQEEGIEPDPLNPSVMLIESHCAPLPFERWEEQDRQRVLEWMHDFYTGDAVEAARSARFEHRGAKHDRF